MMRYFQNPENQEVYGYDETQMPLIAAAVQAKWVEITGNWPPPLTPEQQLASVVSSALAAGLTITSTSTPAINGTYAVDQAAQSRINAIETAILKNGAFPGSNGSQMAYPDITGKLNVFPSTALFSEFATAVADYVADLDLYAAGATGATLPSASVTIA